MTLESGFYSKPVRLHADERIIAVIPEECAGPGWRNRIVWVHLQSRITGKVRIEAIQPEGQGAMLTAMHSAAAEMHRCLISAVRTEHIEKER